MMKNEFTKEDFYEEMKADAASDEVRMNEHEHKLYTDYEFCLEYFNFNEDMTLAEFKIAIENMNKYHAVTYSEILDTI